MGVDHETSNALPNKPSHYEYKFMESIKHNNYQIKGDYWTELLKFILKEHTTWDYNTSKLHKIVNWPEDFLTDSLIKGIKGLNRFSL